MTLKILLACLFLLAFGCKDEPKLPMPARDINTVKEAHTQELMALPGVVGVYVGELSDHTPCITVMVVKTTPELEQKIPKMVEGHPVKIDETGEIKPMK